MAFTTCQTMHACQNHIEAKRATGVWPAGERLSEWRELAQKTPECRDRQLGWKRQATRDEGRKRIFRAGLGRGVGAGEAQGHDRVGKGSASRTRFQRSGKEAYCFARLRHHRVYMLQFPVATNPLNCGEGCANNPDDPADNWAQNEAGVRTLAVRVTNQWDETIPEFSLSTECHYDAPQPERVGTVQAAVLSGGEAMFHRMRMILGNDLRPRLTVSYYLDPAVMGPPRSRAAALSIAGPAGQRVAVPEVWLVGAVQHHVG